MLPVKQLVTVFVDQMPFHDICGQNLTTGTCKEPQCLFRITDTAHNTTLTFFFPLVSAAGWCYNNQPHNI